ncbi:ABC transporter permease [Guggenheimella bovis]
MNELGLAKKSIRANKKRNFFLIFAIILTTFLIASVLSLGASFLKSQSEQQFRFMGTKAHAVISQPKAEIIEKIKDVDFIDKVGTSITVGVVDEIFNLKNVNLSLTSPDQIEWEYFRLPTVTNVQGSFPKSADEIMMPDWIFSQSKIKPNLGMKIEIKYHVGALPSVKKTFKLSGYYTSYMHVRSNGIDSLIVSDAFANEHNLNPSDSGAVFFTFKRGEVSKSATDLATALSIDQEDIKIVPIHSYSRTFKSFVPIILSVFFLLLTGSLLIYNVLHISLTNDIRFIGLLKTLGISRAKIRQFILYQIAWLCAIGIPVGLTLSLATTFILVPWFIRSMGTVQTGASISFSPLIYLGAMLCTIIATLIGSMMPIRKAAKISPIDARKYSEILPSKKFDRHLASGNLWKMAYRNVFREKKRILVVLVSLFLGITTFITAMSLISAMSVDHYIEKYVESDVKLTNTSIALIEGEGEPILDDQKIKDIEALPGIIESYYDEVAYIQIEQTEGLNEHLKNAALSWPSNMLQQQNFFSVVTGIDVKALSQIKTEIDREQFRMGKAVLIATGHPELYSTLKDITFISKAGNRVQAQVAGFAPPSFHQNIQGPAPNIIVSLEFIETMDPSTLKSVLYINVDKNQEEAILSSIEKAISFLPGIELTSRLETEKSMKQSKMLFYILGGGMALILGTIGLLNFVNTMSINIITRKRELALFECIGMGKKKQKQLLIREGLIVAGITILSVSTLGVLIAYGFFKLFQKEASYAVFQFPTLPFLVIVGLVLAVCCFTPTLVYRQIRKEPLTTRVRYEE